MTSRLCNWRFIHNPLLLFLGWDVYSLLTQHLDLFEHSDFASIVLLNNHRLFKITNKLLLVGPGSGDFMIGTCSILFSDSIEIFPALDSLNICWLSLPSAVQRLALCLWLILLFDLRVPYRLLSSGTPLAHGVKRLRIFLGRQVQVLHRLRILEHLASFQMFLTLSIIWWCIPTPGRSIVWTLVSSRTCSGLHDRFSAVSRKTHLGVAANLRRLGLIGDVQRGCFACCSSLCAGSSEISARIRGFWTISVGTNNEGLLRHVEIAIWAAISVEPILLTKGLVHSQIAEAVGINGLAFVIYSVQLIIKL